MHIKFSLDLALKDLFIKSTPFCYCLTLFLLFRIFYVIDASWINHALALKQTPMQWFWQLDSNWYSNIINQGYATTNASTSERLNVVFFPLLPLIIAGLHQITMLPITWLGPIFCQLCFLASLYLFYQLLKLRLQDESTARFGVLLLAFSPANIYFSSFYSESLFLLLSLALILSAFQQKWLWVGICGMLLTATRPNGILILLPVLYLLYQAYKNKQLKFSMLFIALIPLGLLAFMAYLYVHCGDALAFDHNQSIAWGRSGIINSTGIHLLHGGSPRDKSMLLLTIYLSYVLIKRQYKVEALYLIAMLLPAVLSGSIFSFFRFAASAFPIYFGLALISEHKHYLRMFLFTLLSMFSGIFIALWITGTALA